MSRSKKLSHVLWHCQDHNVDYYDKFKISADYRLGNWKSTF